MKKYCVYAHTNKINHKKYIGMTSQKPNERWRNGKGYKENVPFSEDIMKFGWHNFFHEILYTDLSREEAENIEKQLINEYDTANATHGYNIDLGGITGVIFGDSHKANIGHGNGGCVRTSDTKEKLSIAHVGNTSAVRCRIKCIELGRIFDSIASAGRELGIEPKNISAVCCGKRNIAGGYHWEKIENWNSSGILPQ